MSNVDVPRPPHVRLPQHPLAAILMLEEWLADESGYDQETWPELKATFDRDRASAGCVRKLFEE